MFCITYEKLYTVVLTDFSKALNMVDHTFMIEKFIHLGVRGAIVPWLCDFINERVQCVRYHQALAEFRSVVKDTKSNTKNITKSISIHSDYQSVHFW